MNTTPANAMARIGEGVDEKGVNELVEGVLADLSSLGMRIKLTRDLAEELVRNALTEKFPVDRAELVGIIVDRESFGAQVIDQVPQLRAQTLKSIFRQLYPGDYEKHIRPPRDLRGGPPARAPLGKPNEGWSSL